VYIAPTIGTYIQQYYPQQSALDGQQRQPTTDLQYGRDTPPKQREVLIPRPLSPPSLVQRLENGPNQNAINSYVDVANYDQQNRLRQVVGIDVYA